MDITRSASAIALAVSLLVAGAVVCVALATAAPAVRRTARARTRTRTRARAQTGGDRHGLALGAVVGFVVLLATRWPVLAVVAGGLTVAWPQLMRDAGADDERRRIEGIAKWLEDLRDTLRGSSVGAEEALEQVAGRPPAAIADALATFTFRRRQGFRVEDALADLADELDHPTADAAIAAIRLVVGGTAGAARLHTTVSMLAAAARDEVRARERVDRTRAVYRSSMKRLVIIAAVLIGYLRVAAGDLLDPYATATGQLVLVLPVAMWAGCVMWLRSLCRYEPPARYRIVGSSPSAPVAAPRTRQHA